MNELLELVGNLQDCPWSKWAPATLHFCEAHLCERVVAPAETWSNLPYVIVGIIMLTRAWPKAAPRLLASVEARMGLYAVLVGICSALFHASYTYVFETADLAAMNLLGVEMVIQSVRPLGWMKGQSPIAFGSILFVGAFLMLLGTVGTERLWVFGGFVAVALWLEALGFIRPRRIGIAGNYWPLAATVALFALSFEFWWMDPSRAFCVPARHWLSGHAAWHVLNAGCFLTLSSFYRSR